MLVRDSNFTGLRDPRLEPGTIIKRLDVVEDRGASVGAGGKFAVIDGFVFRAAPDGFDKGVVVAVGVLALANFIKFQRGMLKETGELKIRAGLEGVKGCLP